MEMTHPSGTLGAAPSVLTGAFAATSTRLTDLATGTAARVVSVVENGISGSPELLRRLAELGFLPGEKLRIVARGLLGREPLAVRIGTATFALRSFEADCIRVSLEHSRLP